MQTGYEALRTSCAWIDLTSRGKIRVTGQDAGRLLHAMSTNNVNELAPGHGLDAFFLNEKGRIMGQAYIFNLGTEYWLDCEGSAGPVIHHHLDRYIIADDAEVHDETGSWFAVGIEGAESPSTMERLGLPIPDASLAILQTDGSYIARVASTGPLGFRIWPADHARLNLYNRLAELSIPQAVEHEANTVRLENAIPLFGSDISERYLVQETQQLNAVSFNKGCYLGQEIVERVRSQGKVHRLLTPVRVTGTMAPPAGSKLVSNELPAGEVTSASYSPALGEVAAFAYVRSEFLASRPPMQVSGMDPSVQARVA